MATPRWPSEGLTLLCPPVLCQGLPLATPSWELRARMMQPPAGDEGERSLQGLRAGWRRVGGGSGSDQGGNPRRWIPARPHSRTDPEQFLSDEAIPGLGQTDTACLRWAVSRVAPTRLPRQSPVERLLPEGGQTSPTACVPVLSLRCCTAGPEALRT